MKNFKHMPWVSRLRVIPFLFTQMFQAAASQQLFGALSIDVNPKPSHKVKIS